MVADSLRATPAVTSWFVIDARHWIRAAGQGSVTTGDFVDRVTTAVAAGGAAFAP